MNRIFLEACPETSPNRILVHALIVALCLAGLSRIGRSADESELATGAAGLINSGQLDAAAEKLDQAIAQFPDSVRLNVQRLLLAKRLEQAKRPGDAARQYEAMLDYQLRAASKNPNLRPLLSEFVRQLSSLLRKAGQPEAIEPKLDALIQTAESLPDHAILQGILQAHKAMILAELGKRQQAAALADQLVAQAQTALEAAPDDVPTLVRLVNMQKTRIQVLTALRSDQADSARDRLYQLLAEHAPRQKGDASLVTAFVFESVDRAARLSSDDPDAADAVMSTLQQFLDGLDRNNPKIRTTLARAERGIQGVHSRIQTARQHRALVGTPAPLPEKVAAWVNGEPLAPADLKGKVVVLDFWAAWSGPCVARLPQLRQWHQSYADRGLVILGATRYFHIDWDDQQHRIRRVPDLPPEKENEALKRFAQYQQVQYPLAVLTDTSLMEHYGVTAIPQTVVIDRQGIVRTIRTGGRQQAIKELEATIQQCLAEPAPEGER